MEDIFERRAAVLRTVPKFLQGSFGSTLRVAFGEEAFLLLLRMFLHEPPRGGFGPPEEVGGTFSSLLSGKVGRIVSRQSRSRRASQCPDGAKTQEGIHRRFVKAS